MKTSTILTNITKKNNEYITFLENNIKKINFNSNNDKIKAKEELLLKICENHELDYKKLHKKYIKPLKKSNEKDLIEIDSESENDSDEDNKNISLERVTIKDKICYVENIEGGFIYDSEVKKIGVIQKGEYVLYS
jgi:hypothetical protein